MAEIMVYGAPAFFTVIGAVLLVFFCIKRVNGATPFVAMIKAMVSVSFIAAALSSAGFGALDPSRLRFMFFLVMGMIFGTMGDIALDLKYAHRRSEKVYTYAGFLAFLMGHIYYDTALINEFYIKGNALHIIIPVVVSVLVAAATILGEKLMGLEYGQYKGIVFLYSIFLVSFGAFSLSMCILHGFKNKGLNMILAGSVFFMISDFILSGTYFGKGKSRPVDIVVNHLTYYIAQFAVALSLCFVGIE